MAKGDLRRGFKKEANELARELRSELGLAPHEPLCPWRLAEHLNISLFKLSEFQADSKIAYLCSPKGKREFSAMVCFEGIAAFIIYNDAHAPTRQAANIAHEIAHIILRHPPKPPINKLGSRDYDPVLEAEAHWLGPALLISEEAALNIVAEDLTMAQASDVYGASQELITMRINVVGARRRVARKRAA